MCAAGERADPAWRHGRNSLLPHPRVGEIGQSQGKYATSGAKGPYCLPAGVMVLAGHHSAMVAGIQ